MRRSMRRVVMGLSLIGVPALWPAPSRGQSTLQTVTGDGVTIHGEIYAAGLAPDAPLVLLFHQGGSSGRGEYGPLAEWLNGLGYRAIAFDQRAGGDLHGAPNRTAEGLDPEAAAEFCDAYADLQAGLDLVVDEGLSDRPIVWGSSYSGALVFRLAAENPTHVSAVLAFSPASGGPMAACRAREWLDGPRVPRAVFRPATEMERPPAREQRAVLEAAGVDFFVVDDGVHGSSMLVDERTGSDMSGARESVARWLAAAR